MTKKKVMSVRDLIVRINGMVEKNEGMAVPKKRRSKARIRTSLSNWKKKAQKATQKAYNAARSVFAKEKKVTENIEKELVNSPEYIMASIL